MLQYGRQATNPSYNHVHQIMIGMLSLNVPDKPEYDKFICSH